MRRIGTVALLLGAGFFAGYRFGCRTFRNATCVDTLRIVQPVPVDERLAGTVVRRLPLAAEPRAFRLPAPPQLPSVRSTGVVAGGKWDDPMPESNPQPVGGVAAASPAATPENTVPIAARVDAQQPVPVVSTVLPGQPAVPIRARMLQAGAAGYGSFAAASVRGALPGRMAYPDSALVEIPIRRYSFSDSTYRLEVTGYQVEVQRLEFFPVRPVPPPCNASRWGISIGAGLSLSRNGRLEPALQVTVGWQIVSFGRRRR